MLVPATIQQALNAMMFELKLCRIRSSAVLTGTEHQPDSPTLLPIALPRVQWLKGVEAFDVC